MRVKRLLFLIMQNNDVERMQIVLAEDDVRNEKINV